MTGAVGRRVSWVGYVAGGMLLSLVAKGAGAQQFDGPEIVVNTYTTGAQHRHKVAHQPDGSFLVVWTGPGQGDPNGGVFAQLFASSGAPAGGEFRVNTFTTLSQFRTAVAAIGAGDFIVVWGSQGQDGSISGTYGQRISGAGAFLGTEFRVNEYTPGYQDPPRVVGSASGFVVVWDSEGQDGDMSGIYGRCYTAAGAPAGPEFRVNSYTTGYQYRATVGMDAAGNFAVVWTDGLRGQTFGQRFAANCTPAGGEFLAHPGLHGVVSMDGAGNFVVAGENDDLDGNGISARRFSSAGVEQGTEFQVNTYTTHFQYFPEVAVAPAGEFVVTWNTYNLTTFENEDISARAFRADGTPATPEFFVNTYTTGHQGYAATSVGADGRFVVAWRSPSDGDNHGVAAQRFLPADVIFADGFESGDLSAWSSSQGDGANLSVSGAAALNATTAGLQGLVDNNDGLYVQDDTPNDENVYRARFYFDTNGFDPGEAQDRRRVRLFIAFEETPTRRLMAIVLRRLAGVYSLMGRARRDDNSQYNTGFTTISDGSHFVELAWKRASGPDANDGEFQLWIDGASVHSVATLDSSISAVDFVRLGALSVKVGATGTLFWDEFVSRRMEPIGP